MGMETEVKLAVGDIGAVRRTLRRLGARRIRAGAESNVLFDTPDGRLNRAKSALRLRDAGAGFLTFKGCPLPGAYKRREEIEIGVSDVRRTAQLLRRIGLKPSFSYRKRREEWALGVCHVCLDTVPGLGRFVEVEGPSGRSIERALGRLGLEAADRIPHTYVDLLTRRRAGRRS